MKLAAWARSLKRDGYAVWLAAHDPRVPWHAKALAGLVAAYVFSPIDLIPDFIPVLGLLDELIVVPAGVWLVVKLIPPDLWAAHRAAAAAATARPTSWAAAAVFIALWVAAAALSGWLVYRYLFAP